MNSINGYHLFGVRKFLNYYFLQSDFPIIPPYSM